MGVDRFFHCALVASENRSAVLVVDDRLLDVPLEHVLLFAALGGARRTGMALHGESHGLHLPLPLLAIGSVITEVTWVGDVTVHLLHVSDQRQLISESGAT